MSAIPWSAEAEHRLRRRISLLRIRLVMCVPAWCLAIVELLFGTKNALLWSGFALAFFGLAAWMAVRLGHAVLELGCEERLWSGQRIPGSGMLANKPRDTSRLTKWRRLRRKEVLGPLGFTCEQCLRFHAWWSMKWVPNVMECEERSPDGAASLHPGAGDAAAPGPASPAGRAEDVRASDRSQPESSPSAASAEGIDPGGGRCVLICECGMGHYMLNVDRPAKEEK